MPLPTPMPARKSLPAAVHEAPSSTRTLEPHADGAASPAYLPPPLARDTPIKAQDGPVPMLVLQIQFLKIRGFRGLPDGLAPELLGTRILAGHRDFP